MPRIQQLQRNITLLRGIQIVQSFVVTISVIVLYYQYRGLSMADIMILQAVFAAVVVCVEVPSGYFSDVIGRRITMIIGAAANVLGWAWYLMATSMADFVAAEVVLAIGMSFLSGTDSALLYDTMLELETQHQSVHAEGMRLSVGNFSESAASAIGGVLAGISLMLPFSVQVGVAALMIPLTVMLTEPTVHRSTDRPASMADILRVLRETVLHDRIVRWIMITASVLGSATLVMVWFVQPWLQAASVPVTWFGVIWSAGNAVVGLCAMRAHVVKRRFALIPIISVLIAMVVAGYAVLGSAMVLAALPMLLVFYCARGCSNPLFTSAINERVASERRATVLSVRQLGVRAVFVVVGPVLGWVSDHHGMQTALHAAAILVACAGAFTVWRWSVAHRLSGS